jgi:hypothetical protein
MGIHGNTWGFKGRIHGDTWGYTGIHGDTQGCTGRVRGHNWVSMPSRLIRLPATFHTTYDGASTSLINLRNVGGRGPNGLWVAGSGLN